MKKTNIKQNGNFFILFLNNFFVFDAMALKLTEHVYNDTIHLWYEFQKNRPINKEMGTYVRILFLFLSSHFKLQYLSRLWTDFLEIYTRSVQCHSTHFLPISKKLDKKQKGYSRKTKQWYYLILEVKRFFKIAQGQFSKMLYLFK